jgi:lipopolysaccharide transport system permease protein
MYGNIMFIKDIFHHRFFVNFYKYRYLLIELVKRDIKIKYRRSILGLFWSFLEPLLFMVALTLIFSTIFHNSIHNYPVYLLTGRLPFEFFARGTIACMSSVLGNAAIVQKIYVPKYMFSLGLVLSNLVNFLLSLIVLLLVMIATQAPFTLYMLLSIIPIVLLVVFIFGIGLILATLSVFFRDLTYMYGIFVMLIMYGSAIFYPPAVIAPKYQFILTLNPVYAFISLFRDSFYYGRFFDPSQLLFATVSSILALAIGILIFYKYQDKFILFV